jgi:hypothetical protein
MPLASLRDLNPSLSNLRCPMLTVITILYLGLHLLYFRFQLPILVLAIYLTGVLSVSQLNSNRQSGFYGYFTDILSFVPMFPY